MQYENQRAGMEVTRSTCACACKAGSACALFYGQRANNQRQHTWGPECAPGWHAQGPLLIWHLVGYKGPLPIEPAPRTPPPPHTHHHHHHTTTTATT
jgi:hypothetical protein